MKSKKYLLVATFMVATFLNSEEVSVFDAGNVNSQNPYGLTENEKVLLNNKQQVDSVRMNLNDTKESVEGLRTVIEGTNSQIAKLESRVADLEVRTTGKTKGSSEIDQMKSDITWIKSQINEINKKLGANGGSVKKNSEIAQNLQSKTPTKASSNNSFENKDLASVLKEADSLYAKKDYENAKARYSYLVSKNHKPAKATFMLGEISYFQKNYGEAINFYKQSMALNQNADYASKLLYHTAISFDKIGDTTSGTKFYNALKASYPDSSEAKASPSR